MKRFLACALALSLGLMTLGCGGEPAKKPTAPKPGETKPAATTPAATTPAPTTPAPSTTPEKPK